VTVGPGNRWADVYSKLDALGIAIGGGRSASVGVGGLTLGGGVSFFSPRYGFVCDNIIRYEVSLLTSDHRGPEKCSSFVHRSSCLLATLSMRLKSRIPICGLLLEVVRTISASSLRSSLLRSNKASSGKQENLPRRPHWTNSDLHSQGRIYRPRHQHQGCSIRRLRSTHRLPRIRPIRRLDQQLRLLSRW
jgi:FAD/FMN-containing dehydrogenase